MPVNQQLTDAVGQIVVDPEGPFRPGTPRKGQVRWHGNAGAYPHNWDQEGYVDYLYRRDTILVRTADVDLVLRALRANDIIPEWVYIDRLPVIDGVTGLVWRYGRRHGTPPAVAKKAAAAKTASAKAVSSKVAAAKAPDGSAAGARKAAKSAGKRAGDIRKWLAAPPSDDPADILSTPHVLDRLDEVLGPGVATPDHALSLCDGGHPCPATEPAEVPGQSAGPVPPLSDGICCGTHGWDGDGVLVGIVDGGLVADATQQWPWMAGVYGDLEDPYKPGAAKSIKPYSGHGTFVAGCVRCTAPKAEVCVKKAEFIPNRPNPLTAYEHDIIRKMVELLDSGVDVIVCEFDGITRLNRPLRTFEVFYDGRLRQLDSVVVLAPAGNNPTREPTFPAAYSWVIGVGALSADGRRRADFTNFGGWVDVYAPGVDLVNAYAVGDYTCVEATSPPPKKRRFKGLANWSGTSFAAPLVAGMIAARMSATGENAPRAADALLRFARSQAIPGVGPVLYPDQVCGTVHEKRHAGCDCECGKAVLS